MKRLRKILSLCLLGLSLLDPRQAQAEPLQGHFGEIQWEVLSITGPSSGKTLRYIVQLKNGREVEPLYITPRPVLPVNAQGRWFLLKEEAERGRYRLLLVDTEKARQTSLQKMMALNNCKKSGVCYDKAAWVAPIDKDAAATVAKASPQGIVWRPSFRGFNGEAGQIQIQFKAENEPANLAPKDKKTLLNIASWLCTVDAKGKVLKWERAPLN